MSLTDARVNHHPGSVCRRKGHVGQPPVEPAEHRRFAERVSELIRPSGFVRSGRSA